MTQSYHFSNSRKQQATSIYSLSILLTHQGPRITGELVPIPADIGQEATNNISLKMFLIQCKLGVTRWCPDDFLEDQSYSACSAFFSLPLTTLVPTCNCLINYLSQQQLLNDMNNSKSSKLINPVVQVASTVFLIRM